MTRRLFVAGLAGASAVQIPRAREVVLEAVYGAHLPATLRVRGVALPLRNYYELRVYSGGRKYLIPWDSLEQRNRAWADLNRDSDWIRRPEHGRLAEVTIYRQPGGSIFEMSL